MKKLLWIAGSIFTLELLVIIGYYWIFQEYAGNTMLTISRYVGLSPATILIFLAGNLAVISCIVLYMFNSGIKKTAWRALIYVYAVCFLALSICPHVQEGGQIVFIHKFFAAGVFLSLLLEAIVTIGMTENKLARAFLFAFIIFAVCVCMGELNDLAYHNANKLIFETLYIYGGFVTLLCAPIPKPKVKKSLK